MDELHQKAFNVVKTHLLAQGQRSLLQNPVRSTSCAYRGQEGRKCALGALIDDKHYDFKLEGQGPSHFDVEVALADSGWAGLDVNWARTLQSIHDEVEPEQWKEALDYFEIHQKVITDVPLPI